MSFTQGVYATPPKRLDSLLYTQVLTYQTATATPDPPLGTEVQVNAVPAYDPLNPVAVPLEVAFPLERGYVVFRFRDAAGTYSPASAPFLSPDSVPGGYYGTVQQLRDELGDQTITDADGARTLTRASDYVDGLLGFRWVDPDTGRKVLAVNVEAWRFTRLCSVTVQLAARITADPGLLAGRAWQSESGPDFSVSGPVGSGVMGDDLIGLLNDTGLRRLTTRAGRRGHNPQDDFSVNTDFRYETDTYR